MRLKTSKSKNSMNFYIQEDYTRNGKRTTNTVHTIGNLKSVIERAGTEDYMPWLKEYIRIYAEENTETKEEIIIRKNAGEIISKNNNNLFDVGHLFIRKIYNDLKIPEICDNISKKYKFQFDLDQVLSHLIYGRIIYPGSKLRTWINSKKFLYAPKLQLQYNYRGLTYLNNEMDYIQKTLYDNSLNIVDRDSRVIFIDGTNFHFEISEEDELRKYGINKQHQPKPQVGMLLAMDSDGIPLGMSIYPGNASETKQLLPMQEKIIKKYNLKNPSTIICTDAAMCTDEIKRFNTKDGRGFVITQSLKKLKKEYRAEVFVQDDWRIAGDLRNLYNINDIQNDDYLSEKYYETLFYKIIPTETNSVKQDLIVTFSLKYRDYRSNIRDSQIERANSKIKNNKKNKGAKMKLNKSPNDFRRFISEKALSKDDKKITSYEYSINQKQIEDEKMYDGYYGITTNLNDGIETILKITKGRWEIEESFRIMKHDFATRPLEMTREDRITAHFLTCYMSLLIYRLIEKKLNYKYTTFQILTALRSMKVLECKGDGFLPSYERTDLTDDLHDSFGFRTDYEILTYKYVNKIFKNLKK